MDYKYDLNANSKMLLVSNNIPAVNFEEMRIQVNILKKKWQLKVWRKNSLQNKEVEITLNYNR
jgi:hypothetical protein